MYTKVYAPDGEMFEIASRDLADRLILQEGWTQTPHEKVEESAGEDLVAGFTPFTAKRVVE